MCTRWPSVNAVAVCLNLVLLYAFWKFGFELADTLEAYEAVVWRFSQSVRQRLLAFVTRPVPVEAAVYLRVFALSSWGIGTSLAAYAIGASVLTGVTAEIGSNAVAGATQPSSNSLVLLVLVYAALLLASLLYLEGLPALPITLYKSTPVSFHRLTLYLVLPHVILFSPVALLGAVLALIESNSVGTAMLLLILPLMLPVFAWVTGVRFWTRRLFPPLFYIGAGLAGMIAVALQPVIFLVVAGVLLVLLYRGATRTYDEVGVDEFKGRADGQI